MRYYSSNQNEVADISTGSLITLIIDPLDYEDRKTLLIYPAGIMAASIWSLYIR